MKFTQKSILRYNNLEFLDYTSNTFEPIMKSRWHFQILIYKL